MITGANFFVAISRSLACFNSGSVFKTPAFFRDSRLVKYSLLYFACACFTYSATANADVDLSDYSLVFSDEFNGSQLNKEKWNTAFLWGPYLPINAEEQLYIDTLGMHSQFSRSPFEFTGSSLKIVASKKKRFQSSPSPPIRK